MKREEIVIQGRSNSKGEMLIYNREEMVRFFQQWPDVKFTMSVKVYAKKTSGAQIGYYKNAVLPALVDGWKVLGEDFTKNQADEEIRKLSPVCQKHDPEHGDIVVPVTSLSMSEMSQHIGFCIRTAAQEFGVAIPNPKY